MRIDANRLKIFFTKTTLNGEIPSALLTIENGIGTINVNQTDNTTFVLGTFKKFPQSTEKIIYGIRDTKTLLKMLNNFNGDIELQLDNNILAIYDKDTRFNYVLAEEEFIDNKIPSEVFQKIDSNLVVKDRIKMLSAPFKDIIKLMSSVNSETININIKDKRLLLTTGNKSFDSAQKSYPIEYKDINVTFGTPFISVINNIGDKIEFGGNTDKPITLKETTDDYEITYIIAPRVDIEE